MRTHRTVSQPPVHADDGCYPMSCRTFLVRLVRWTACSNVASRLTGYRTSLPPTQWIVPILGGFPFGCGIAQIMQGLVQYIMDTYTIYCASAIASTVVLRSAMAAVFPLISPAMYSHLGPRWAASVFAFLSLACTPLPFLFYVSA